jgi:hypothetical protein
MFDGAGKAEVVATSADLAKVRAAFVTYLANQKP